MALNGGSAIGFLKERSFFTGELFNWLLPQGPEQMDCDSAAALEKLVEIE